MEKQILFYNKLHGTRVFLKATVSQLFRKFPAFYGTQRFIILFTRACDWALFSAILIQSTS
jgi:hypothetical protein